jgi:uncharacterized membrane protein
MRASESSKLVSRWKSRGFAVLLFLQFSSSALILLNVPVARQVIGFLYLTFIPGFIVVKLLKLYMLDRLETVLFSVGLSVAFLMIAGLLINEFGLLLGVLNPLSVMPLMIILNTLILVGGIFVHLRNRDCSFSMFETLKLPLSSLLFLIPVVLSVAGTMWMNIHENNVILLFMIVSIASLIVVGVLSKKFLQPRLYPFALFAIAVSLLFHASLISSYIYTGDVHMEYFIFKTTENNARWSSIFMYPGDIVYGRINSMLSITILPTIYSVMLNMEATWVLKILYPIIFSFVPLALYKLWQKNIGAKRAFIAAFLFMAMSVFYTEMLGLNRQMIAELFFVLLLLVVLNKDIKSSNKMIFFTIFSVALITSHYSLAEIFLIFISISLISLAVLKRPSGNITESMVVLFFVVMFVWYIYTSRSAVFDSFVNFGDYVFSQLGNFFEPASRGQTVLRGLGLEAAPSIWNTISRIFAYLTQALIVVGFIGMLMKRVKTHLEKDYFMLSLIAMAFLATLILVPGLANTLRMERFYHTLLFFLAPFCVIGAEVIVNLVSKRGTKLGTSILLLIVLVPYFLFQTSFVYEVAGVESWSVPLSKYRIDRLFLGRYYLYVDEPSVFGGLWVTKNINSMNVQLYTDLFSRYSTLTSYGMIYPNSIITLSNTTTIVANGLVYLSQLNVVYGKIPGENYIWNSTEFSSLLNDMNKVYSNGACEIYVSVP